MATICSNPPDTHCNILASLLLASLGAHGLVSTSIILLASHDIDAIVSASTISASLRLYSIDVA